VLFAIVDNETPRALVKAHEDAVAVAVGCLEGGVSSATRPRRIEPQRDGFGAAAHRQSKRQDKPRRRGRRLRFGLP
jgi:hypothetical protein